MLNKDEPDVGKDLMTHMRAKYGEARANAFAQRLQHLHRAGTEAGISFHPKRWIIATNSCHELLELCSEKHPGLTDRVMREMFRRYFEANEDVSTIEALCRIAVETGVPEAEARSALTSGQYTAVVLQKCEDARQRHGVTGVPLFIIEKADGAAVKFSGAQSAEFLAEQLRRAAQT